VLIVHTLFLLKQVLRNQLEDKRPLVEHSLETGRMYLRDEGVEDKRMSTDSGEGMFKVIDECLDSYSLKFGNIEFSSSNRCFSFALPFFWLSQYLK